MLRARTRDACPRGDGSEKKTSSERSLKQVGLRRVAFRPSNSPTLKRLQAVQDVVQAVESGLDVKISKKWSKIGPEMGGRSFGSNITLDGSILSYHAVLRKYWPNWDSPPACSAPPPRQRRRPRSPFKLRSHAPAMLTHDLLRPSADLRRHYKPSGGGIHPETLSPRRRPGPLPKSRPTLRLSPQSSRFNLVATAFTCEKHAGISRTQQHPSASDIGEG